jgi:uncharacterized protein (TIGR02588 family)
VAIPSKNWLEWMVAALSLALIGAILCFLAVDALATPAGAARIAAEVEAPIEHADQLRLPVKISNTSDQPVEQVIVAVTIEQPDGSLLETELTIDQLARGGTAEGEVIIPPGSGPAQARVLSYQIP